MSAHVLENKRINRFIRINLVNERSQIRKRSPKVNSYVLIIAECMTPSYLSGVGLTGDLVGLGEARLGSHFPVKLFYLNTKQTLTNCVFPFQLSPCPLISSLKYNFFKNLNIYSTRYILFCRTVLRVYFYYTATPIYYIYLEI